MTSLHKNLPVGEIHIPYSWQYNNATERLAATGFLAEDVGKLAWQLDNNSIWLLSSVTPTWVQVGGVASGTEAALLYLECRKGSGGTIAVGKPVYQSGYNLGGWIEVELAEADVPGSMPCIGLAQETLTTAATGQVVVAGRLSGFNTTSWSDGDPLYVDVTAGDLTNTKPAGATTGIQKVGSVLYSHPSQGVVLVSGANRTNDLPNLGENKTWKGDASGYPQEADFPTIIFGADYQREESLAESQTTLNTYQDKVTLTTPALTGTYRVGWSAMFNNNDKAGFGRLYNVTDAVVIGDEIPVRFKDSADKYWPFGTAHEVLFTGASKTFKVQWRDGAGGQTQSIKDAYIEFWRVS
ncbi:MAG: hypothetical protein JSW58_06290 [Candidatus Latescibacterota bacterium]|nr:MAG: hypothetical protein JSW58_06290 [Candidatus Latescibacterota bacterium]